jgi:hypothetical protein
VADSLFDPVLFDPAIFDTDAPPAIAEKQYVVEIMWNGTDWDDETDFLLTAQWKRGRDYASQLTGRASAGEMTLVLDNPQGRYAPLNASSPLYGYLLPGRKIRLRSTTPVAATLWTGFLEEIRPSPGRRDSAPTAILRASGPLKYIADKKASTAIYTSISTGTAVGHILNDAGWPGGDRALDSGQITMTRWKADGDSALSHLQELEEMEFGYVGETKDGKIVWEDANHRLNAPHTTSQATFTDAEGGTLSYSDVEEKDPWREVFNDFRADVIFYSVQPLGVLWTMDGETPAISPGVTLELWAQYPNPSSPPEADSVDAWTTPVATTDFLANTQADGLGTDKTSAITVGASKFANSMKISLTNTDPGQVFITFLQARGTATFKNDPIGVRTEDAVSQSKFGIRTYPLPGKFYPSVSVAKAYTEAGLARFKDQLAILSLTFRANQSSAHMTQALSRDVSDRVSLVAQGTLPSGAQLGINGDFFIEAERHQLDLGGHWVTYDFSDARTLTGYWLLDVGELDVTTKLAP